jgi:hypothetical protein
MALFIKNSFDLELGEPDHRNAVLDNTVVPTSLDLDLGVRDAYMLFVVDDSGDVVKLSLVFDYISVKAISVR